jgi:hypothetical protein
VTWITEDPLPLLIIGAVGFALLVLGYLASRNGRFLLAAAGLAMIVAALAVTERWIVTEAEQVEAAVWDLAGAVEENDLDAVIQALSPSADHLKQAAQAALPQVRVTAVSIKGLETEVAGTATPRMGTARFRARVEFSATELPNQFSHDKWELTFRREQGKWLLFNAVRSSAVGPERVQPLVPGGN